MGGIFFIATKMKLKHRHNTCAQIRAPSSLLHPSTQGQSPGLSEALFMPPLTSLSLGMMMTMTTTMIMEEEEGKIKTKPPRLLSAVWEAAGLAIQCSVELLGLAAPAPSCSWGLMVRPGWLWYLHWLGILRTRFPPARHKEGFFPGSPLSCVLESSPPTADPRSWD